MLLPQGFGYIDAMDVDASALQPEWIIQDLLPYGLGFIAGPPKGGNSPEGGKSVFVRALAYSLRTGQPFLSHRVLMPGSSLIMNLDETIIKQSEKLKVWSQGQSMKGIYLSQAVTANFPADLLRLEEDIKALNPIMVNIDPLLRGSSGRNLSHSHETTPITSKLKQLTQTYRLSFPIVHHGIKSREREKETTASWLSGSTDLDSVWDFCFCLEYDTRHHANHVRCFYRYHSRKDFYYQAVRDARDEIIGFKRIDPTLDDKHKAILRFLSTCQDCRSSTPVIQAGTFLEKRTILRKLEEMLGQYVQKDGGEDGGAFTWSLVNGVETAF